MYISWPEHLKLNCRSLKIKLFKHHSFHNYLSIELSQELKVLLQIGGEDRFDDQEPESLELSLVQPPEPVIARRGEEESPGRGSVMGLQH